MINQMRRAFNQNRGRFVLLLSLMLLLPVGCTNQGPPGQPTPAPEVVATEQPSLRGSGGTLKILYWDAPTILNPHLTTAQKDHQVVRITLEPLASVDKDGNLIPFLAAEIPSPDNGGIAADGKSVTWKLKQGVFWSDGEPFTAADVKFTYEFVTNPAVKASSKSIYEVIAGIDIVDDYTVKVNFKDVNPAWNVPFVGGYGSILPKHKFEAYNGSNAADAPANIEPVGTGPYRVVPPGIKPQEVIFLGNDVIHTNKIVFEPNPFFREKDKPFFSRVEVRGGGTPDEAARLALETGDVDYAWSLDVSTQVLESLEKTGVGKIVPIFGTRVEQLEPNFTDPNKQSSTKFPHPFLTDLKVRQAIAHAIDRAKIVALYGLTGEATDHILVLPDQFKSDKTFYDFDLDQAKALLEEDGWVDTDGDGIREKDGRKLSVLYQTYDNALPRETQRIIQGDLAKIGFEVNLKRTDPSVFFGSGIAENPDHNGRFLADLQEADWSSTSPDPGAFLLFWTCDQIPQQENGWQGLNFRRYCNLDYDALYEKSKTEIDPEKRRDIFIKMNDMLSEDVATIPLVRIARIAGISQKLQGFDPTPWDSEAWNIKDWRLEQQP